MVTTIQINICLIKLIMRNHPYIKTDNNSSQTDNNLFSLFMYRSIYELVSPFTILISIYRLAPLHSWSTYN